MIKMVEQNKGDLEGKLRKLKKRSIPLLNRPLYYIGSLVLAGIAGLLIGTCINTSKSKRLLTEKNALEKQVEGYSIQLDEKEKEIDEKEKEIKKLKVLEQQVEEYRKRTAQTQTELKETVSELEGVKSQKSELEKNSEEKTGLLQNKINELEKEVQDKQAKIGALEKENKEEKETHREYEKEYRNFLHSALSAFGNENWDNAINNFQHLIVLEPSEPSLYYFIAQCYEKKGLIEKAQREYENALRVDGSFLPALEALDNIAKQIAAEKERNSIGGRIKSLEKQIQQNPEQELLYLELSKDYIKKGDKELALAILERGISKRPFESRPLQALYAEMIPDDSSASLEKGIKFFEELRKKYSSLGLERTISELYVRLGRHHTKGNDELFASSSSILGNFRKAIEFDPTWAVPYCEIGENTVEFPCAYENLNKAIKLDPSWSKPWLVLARVQRRDLRVKPKAAISSYKKAISLDPSSEATLEHVRYILSGMGIEDEYKRDKLKNSMLSSARGFLRDKIQEHPKERKLQLALADVYMGLHEWHKAIILLERDGKLHTEPDARVLLALGRCYKERNMIDKAKTHFQEALKTDPNSSAAGELEIIAHNENSLKLWLKLDGKEKREQQHLDYNRARKLFENKEWNSAIWLLERYNNSGSSEIHLLLGQAYMVAGKFDEAKSAFERAESLEKGNAVKNLKGFKSEVIRYFRNIEWDIYAICNKDNQDSTEIQEILFELYQEAYRILPIEKDIKIKKSGFARKLGQRYEEKGDLEKAVEFFEKDEMDNNSKYKIGKIKEKTGNLEEAIEIYRKLSGASSVNKSHVRISLASALLNLGRQRLNQGKTEEAIQYLREALTGPLNKIPILYDLARTYKQVGDLINAEKYFEKVAGIHFLSGYYLEIRGKAFFELGLIYENKKGYYKAKEYFNRATLCNSSYIDAYLHYGKACLEMKNKESEERDYMSAREYNIKAKWAYEKAAELGSSEARTVLQSLENK